MHHENRPTVRKRQDRFLLRGIPPKKTSPVDSIYKTLDGLKDIHPDFISVTFGAGGSSNVNQSTAEIASIIQNQYHITAMAHLTCVGCTKGRPPRSWPS